jgi:ribonuclease BN (tRNA processing enzyme)
MVPEQADLVVGSDAPGRVVVRRALHGVPVQALVPSTIPPHRGGDRLSCRPGPGLVPDAATRQDADDVVKLVFLGTRGYIGPRSRRHRWHTATLVCYRGRRVLVDCGESWRGRLGEIRPHAVVITHAHPDHAFGLDAGAPCPVFATAETWERIEGFPLRREQRRLLAPRCARRIEGMRFEAFPVLHSVRAPAVGYRIRAGRVGIFYVPDVVSIPAREAALRGVRAYVGDGASVVRNMVRRHRASGELFGHATIRAQLGWCAEAGIPRMIVTHCGSDIVGGDERVVGARIRALAAERGVAVEVAHDGMQRVLR